MWGEIVETFQIIEIIFFGSDCGGNPASFAEKKFGIQRGTESIAE